MMQNVEPPMNARRNEQLHIIFVRMTLSFGAVFWMVRKCCRDFASFMTKEPTGTKETGSLGFKELSELVPKQLEP
eukprot:494617-Amphidinium_carterae.1